MFSSLLAVLVALHVLQPAGASSALHILGCVFLLQCNKSLKMYCSPESLCFLYFIVLFAGDGDLILCP
jgi:hypothetical protein